MNRVVKYPNIRVTSLIYVQITLILGVNRTSTMPDLLFSTLVQWPNWAGPNSGWTDPHRSLFTDTLPETMFRSSDLRGNRCSYKTWNLPIKLPLSFILYQSGVQLCMCKGFLTILHLILSIKDILFRLQFSNCKA